MDLETLATLSIPAMFLAFIGIERIASARPLPKVPLWKAKGVLFFLTTVALSTVAPLVWLDFVHAHRLMNLESLGVAGGAALAVVVTQLVAYWWHRTMHRTPLLWRWFHQMHHSAERIDVFGAMYFHPLDVLGFAFVQSVVPFFVLGVAPEAALVAGVFGTFLSLFQHTNVRTPRWLGVVIQRPESHSLHHARGVHAHNYADLPIWDIVFGTFANPASFEAEAGFWNGGSKRVGAMLLGRDVSEPPAHVTPAEPARRAAA
jgi:sterol desaturase/sphingolipid hydroxylase (fatty acid hydroxylase superfamily)